MTSDNALIAWKTNAWKDPTMVAGYAERMRDPAGTIMFKNRIEVSALAKYVKGPALLDVGIGTGRASLPLARAGYTVTGIDSSTEMLQKTRTLAGDTPIDLRPGDVAALPFAANSFDSVMSLNTISHFPHWQPIVREWQRVTKPHGRIVFDLFSLDHDIAYARSLGQSEDYAREQFAAKDASAFYLRLRIDDIVAFADELGLRIAAIQPYSVLLGSAGFSRFFDQTPLSGTSWDRLLSWIAADPALFDFLTFLEEELFGKLTTAVACRFMAVFDNTPDAPANAQLRARNNRVNERLQSGLSIDALHAAHIDVAHFRQRLNAFFAHAPNRFALYRMLVANLGWNWPIAAELLDEPYRSQAAAVVERATLDRDVTRVLTRFHRDPTLRDALEYRGVPLAAAGEYNAMIAALSGTFGAFEGNLTAPILAPTAL